jgi:predicted GNAT family acetyltransferase
MTDPVTVHHNMAAERFEARVEGRISVADYQMVGRTMWLTHTAVPPAQRGLGIAQALVAAALAHARREGLRVRPACSYVNAYLRRHPEQADLVAPGNDEDDDD